MIILASDYDGTLKINGKIAEADDQAIRSFQAQGNLFGIVTGRTVGMIKHELMKYHVPFDFLICANGATIVNQDYHILEQTDLCFDDALDLIEDCKQRNVSIIVSDGNQYGPLFDHRKNISNHKQAPEPNEDRISGDEILKRKRIGLMVICSDSLEESLSLKNELEQKYKGKMNFHYNNGVIDVTAWNVDKSQGIKKLEEKWKVSFNVIGDGYNDICMLDEFNSFAVNHASDEVKKHAKYCVASIEECIEKLLEKGE